MKTKTKYTKKFQEVYDDSYKQLYIRTFGNVIIGGEKEKKVNLLCIAEIYDLDRSHAVRLEELPDQKKPVMLTFSLLPELKNISKKHIEAARDSGGSGDELLDVYEYMGGLRFEPSKVVWFATNEEALAHINSKEVSDQISGMGMMSGFVMDQHYNRIGETNWDRLDKIMTGK